MRKFIQGIKNLIAWFPIIWNDRDWDYFFLLVMIQFKLKRMLKGLTACHNWHYHSGSAKQIQNIQIAIALLERQLSGSWYYDNALLFHRKKYGKPKHVMTGRFFKTIYPETTKLEKAEKEAHQLINQSHIHEQQDWEYLFDLFKKNVRNWWD